jgi:hypothetical protein
MSEQQRTLVRLRDRYPDASRMTRWRIRNLPDFPVAIVVRGTEYFYQDELVAFEQRRRRRKASQQAADTTTA